MLQTIFSLLVLTAFLTAGCATAPSQKNNKEVKSIETKNDIQSAVGSVVSTIKGEAVRVKYCPVCAKHYSSKLGVCPADGAKLKEVEE